jgi:tripartite-type tricarboxylate transporter receptor subunit TctC
MADYTSRKHVVRPYAGDVRQEESAMAISSASRYVVSCAWLAAALLQVPLAARAPAADFPSRPVRWIVPFPPGGSNDVLGRYLGGRLSERIGQQVVIDNRGGANGIIAAEMASHSAPDGHTVLMISPSFLMNAAVRSKPLPYDVERSFDPISTIATAPNCIVVAAQGPFRTLRDLVDQAKAQPGRINYASTGVGGFNHFGGELFKKVAGIDMVMVPYKGGGPAMIDVIAGNVPVMFSSVTQTLAHVRAGRLRLLAVGAAKRSPVVPDVPTVAEAGFPGYEVQTWWGLSAPAGVPRAVHDKLRRELVAVLQEPQTTKWLLADAAEPLILAPVELRKFIREERKKWTEVAKEANIKVQ